MKHSDKKLARILRSSQSDQEKYLEEAWNEMSESDRRRFMRYLDEDLNIFSEKNRAKMRKFNRTRPRRRSS